MKSAKEIVGGAAIKQALNYARKDPDKNLIKLVELAEKLDKGHVNQKTYDNLRVSLQNPDDNWNRFFHRLLTELDPGVQDHVAQSLGVNAAIKAFPQRMASIEKYGCNIPWAILMDPTAACNLHCTGCWAAEYGKNCSLPYDVMERIIAEGEELGDYVYLFSGGEPLCRKDDLIRLCESHPECVFLSFTNGTLVDEAFAKEMKRVGNFALAFSIEGWEEETDMRRGKGTYQKVLHAMDLLRAEGVPFGFSCCYHSKNTEVIGSDEWVNFLIDKGCLFGWYFTYIPCGKDAVPELLATPEQRRFMYDRVRYFRKTKPAFLLDFWNDGEYVQGCVAGGRNYLHINANGDVEPCAFIHYSNVNIKDCSLLEALQSPLFLQYKQHQPFNCNHLRPCPMLDNPEMIQKMVHASGAHSTDMLKPEAVDELVAKTRPAAEKWQPVADRLWEESETKKDVGPSKLYPKDGGRDA